MFYCVFLDSGCSHNSWKKVFKGEFWHFFNVGVGLAMTQKESVKQTFMIFF